MPKLLDILKSCKKYGYFDVDCAKNVIKYTNLGTLFTQNIKRQWMLESEIDVKVYPNRNIYNCETSSPGVTNDMPKLLFNCQKFHSNFLQVQKDFQRTVPFAIAQEILFRDNVISLLQSDNTPPAPTVDRTPTHFLSHLYFIHPYSETEVFNRVQRTKKIWWMKYALNPGRIFLSDRVDNVYNTLYIKARYDFGDLILEKVQSIPFDSVIDKNKYDYSLWCSATSRRIQPHIIRTETCLEIATIGLLCDAINTDESETLHVHRKLAPYQCAVLVDTQTAPHKNDLMDYAKFLSLNLKTERVSVGNLLEKSSSLNFVHSNKETLNHECRKLDSMGVPYVLIVNEETLKRGKLQLRQRDTGLSEVIHVSDIPNEIVRNLS